MAELVDAPDSKSGHCGGVGSIPSTPTNKNLPLSNFRFKKATCGCSTLPESEKLWRTYNDVKE